MANLAGVVGAGVLALILFFLGYKTYTSWQQPPAEAFAWIVSGALDVDQHGRFTKEHLTEKMFALKVDAADKESVHSPIDGQDQSLQKV